MASLMDEYRKQMMWANLARVGQGLITAGGSRMPVGQGLAYGIGQVQPMDPTRMRMLRKEEREEQARQGQQKWLEKMWAPTAGPPAQYADAGGPHPPTASPPGPSPMQKAGLPETLKGAPASLQQELYIKQLLAGQKEQKDQKVQGADGYWYWASGDKAGQRILPGVTAKPEKPSERQQKITELRARGFSQQQAEDVASGRVRPMTDPITGAISFANVATGQVTQPAGQPTLPKKTRAAMATQSASINALLGKMPALQGAIEKGVGAVPVLQELAGRTLGQLPTGSVDIPGIGKIGTGEEAVDPEVVKARTSLRIFREEIIAAFRKSGRVPVQEQKRILEFVDKLGFLNSVPDAKLAFEQLEQELTRVRDTYEEQLDPPSVPGIETMQQPELDALDMGALSDADLAKASARYRELVGP